MNKYKSNIYTFVFLLLIALLLVFILSIIIKIHVDFQSEDKCSSSYTCTKDIPDDLCWKSMTYNISFNNDLDMRNDLKILIYPSFKNGTGIPRCKPELKNTITSNGTITSTSSGCLMTSTTYFYENGTEIPRCDKLKELSAVGK